MKVAFYTSLFVGDQFKKPDTPSTFDKMENYDYFLFTNLDKDLFNTSWTIVNIDFPHISNSIIKSRIPKFQPWKLDILKDYDIVIFCDAYWSPVNNSLIWSEVINQIKKSKNGIIQSANPYRICPYKECDELIELKKESKERIQKTKDFFEKEKLPHDFGLWRNTFLLINMKNDKVKTLFDNFWEFYKQNIYTHRDQPIYSYIIYKTNINPENIFLAKAYKHVNGLITKQASINLFKITGKISNHTYT